MERGTVVDQVAGESVPKVVKTAIDNLGRFADAFPESLEVYLMAPLSVRWKEPRTFRLFYF